MASLLPRRRWSIGGPQGIRLSRGRRPATKTGRDRPLNPASMTTPNRPQLPRSEQKLKELEAMRAKNGGWSSKPPEGAQVTEFPLITTKRSLLEGIRHHIMRFNQTKTGKPIDPTDEDDFARPVTLRRRDPRFQPTTRMAVKEEEKSYAQPRRKPRWSGYARSRPTGRPRELSIKHRSPPS